MPPARTAARINPALRAVKGTGAPVARLHGLLTFPKLASSGPQAAGRCVDRFEEMAVFVAAAELGGLAAASRQLGVSAPTATRAINALEQRIGTPLLVRTTRSVTLTDAGRRYLDECRRLLAAIAEAEEHAAGAHAKPHGILTVTAPVLFGQMYMVPLALRFLDLHADVTIRLRFSDRVVSLVEDGIDVALRISELADSSMVAVRVGAVRRVICASPALIEREGAPRTPDELTRFRIVAAANVTPSTEWRFVDRGQPLAIRIEPVLAVTSNRAAIAAAERGFGLTRVMSYQVAPQLAAGRLVRLLADFELPPVPAHLVYAQGRQASAKVRAFVDHCAAALRGDPALG